MTAYHLDVMGWETHTLLYVYTYWLFKLHGLKCNHYFYSCEMICGNESYRGRHNFEKHFAEAKHSYGMKCLEIPNTKHFHGVTKIEDAQNLWRKLQEDVNKDVFDASKEEEYEDSQGNVLSRATYEDLARQGLLEKYDWIHHSLISWFITLQSASSTCSWY